MRFDVKKFLFVGLDDDRMEFFERAQEIGIVQFIKNKAQAGELPAGSQNIARSIKILRGHCNIVQKEIENESSVNFIVDNILSLDKALEELREEQRITQQEILQVAPFGEFSNDDKTSIEEQGNRIIQFYAAKKSHIDPIDLSNELIHISSINDMEYFIAIHKERKQYPKFTELNITRSLSALRNRLQEIDVERYRLEVQLKEFAKYTHSLRQSLASSLNNHTLNEAKENITHPLEQTVVFSIEGWVPQHKIHDLQSIVSGLGIHCEEVAQESHEKAPTFLENKGIARLGEDLVNLYDTPSATDADPSMWVLISFSLFFAMIIGDGGYGLVMLFVALYLRKKRATLSLVASRALNLFTILCFFVIAWGVLTTSFFGMSIAPNHPIRKISLISWLVEKKVECVLKTQEDVYKEWIHQFPELVHVSHPTELLVYAQTSSPSGLVSFDIYNKFADHIMMELALLVGVIHVMLSMLRYIRRNPQNTGWIVFLIGAYLYIPYFLEAKSIPHFVFGLDPKTGAEIGVYMMAFGFATASIIALVKHKLLGLLEPTVLIQIFGDVLSYLRIYALGLAGALMTSTMNEMAASVPMAFGIILLIIGHSINIVLGIQGGIIHGLRLNFLEWYHYSFEGDGKMFKALKKLDTCSV